MDDIQPVEPPVGHPRPLDAVNMDSTVPAAADSQQELDNQASGAQDTETPSCRICRGEETPEEPLFYPCKCNGSIRFVHQACLMEWLARSQKRHCELCKTPFRFTKLYDPQMPSSVPFPVFARQAVIQVGRTILRFLRYILVAFVWLAWVPWTMRTMWRFLFWLGDGAWLDHRGLRLPGYMGMAFNASGMDNSTLMNSQTTSLLASNGSALATTSPYVFSSVGSWITAIHKLLLPSAFGPDRPDPLEASQTNHSQSLVVRLGARWFREPVFTSGLPVAKNATYDATIPWPIVPRQASMLSDMKFLQNFSRWPALNQTVTDILEGQLITLFVMVLIILVFLIREWVVQQQPNFAAPRGPAPAELAIDDRRAAVEAVRQDPPVANEPVVEAAPEGPQEEETVDQQASVQGPGTATTDPAHNEQSTNSELSNRGDTQALPTSEESHDRPYQPVPDDSRTAAALSPLQTPRPPMPRHALDRASELQRVLEEERTKVAGDKWPGVQTFMDYWHRGDCLPQRVLELIKEEGREEELAWIVNAMHRLEETEISTGDMTEEQIDALAADSAQSAPEAASGSDQSWQVLDEGSGAQAPLTGPSSQPEGLPSNVPNWLDTQTLAWPPNSPENGPVGPELAPNANEATVEGQPAHEDPIQQADGPQAPDVSETLAQPPQPDTHNDADAIEDAALEPAQEAPAAEAIPPVAQGGDAGARGTLWDQLANLLWPNVDLPPAEQQRVANLLEPILQPEADHEPPMPPAPAPRDDQQQAADPAPGAAAVAAPNPNPAAGVLPAQDPEVLRAAREAGVEPEDIQAIDDGEDLEGLVELIGLQGPLIALVQHGMVCGAIVTLVVFFGIWVPYIIGKVVLVLISNPVTLLVKLPLRWTSFVINVLIDTAIFLFGNTFFLADRIIRAIVAPIGWAIPAFARIQENTIVPDTAFSFAVKSVERLGRTFAANEGFTDNDIPYFSVIAHESLVQLEDRTYNATIASYAWLESTLESSWTLTGLFKWSAATLMSVPNLAWKFLGWEMTLLRQGLSAMFTIARTNPFKMRLEFPERTEPFNLELVHWNTRDRILAIMFGYLAFYLAGAAYVKMRYAMRNANAARDEALEILSQAGGVLKVILIISIEMIAFPLYCGLLLDIAMLPLFQNQNLLQRLNFAVANPLTSMFLHWFVGTCYMFHFALFVSMCRKAMRPGVLYFIRDPDDPTFHPVRDVLERNLVGQLRKILFSALVYGALVIVCLGAVVWGVASLPVKILPIKWSSLNPATELPIDLIVLNFLIPVAVRVLDPSQGLEAMYKWWFRRCARALRLSHFLFDERREDEEGQWVDSQSDGSISSEPGKSLVTSNPSDRSTEVYSSEHATSTSTDLTHDELTNNSDDALRVDFYKDGELVSPSTAAQDNDTNETKSPEPAKGRTFIRQGRFVRAPGSDQVRIPRNKSTFIRVDEDNNRIDGLPEPEEGALYAKGTELFKLVWLPPHFQLRIGLFIFLLWTFAAVTGLGMTIFPLCFGRYVFQNYLPPNAPVNDIHAFCLGAYVVGGPVFLAINHHTKLTKAYRNTREWIATNISNHDVANVVTKAFSTTFRALRVLYFYSFFGIVLPTLLAAVFEFYVFVPLNTRAGTQFVLIDRFAKISFIQNWTVGVLYLRIIGRVIHSNQESRPARALFALVAPANNGSSWWDPDVKLATRAFFLPALALVGAALTAPLLLGYIANALYFRTASTAIQTAVYRYSYPALAATALMVFFTTTLIRSFRKWRMKIRDEVYLIGERLHNFGDKRGPTAAGSGVLTEAGQ